MEISLHMRCWQCCLLLLRLPSRNLMWSVEWETSNLLGSCGVAAELLTGHPLEKPFTCPMRHRMVKDDWIFQLKNLHENWKFRTDNFISWSGFMWVPQLSELSRHRFHQSHGLTRPVNHDKSQKIWKQFETSRHVQVVVVFVLWAVFTIVYLENEIYLNVS